MCSGLNCSTYSAIQENVDGGLALLRHTPLRVNGPECDEGPDGVADVVAPVGEGPESGGHDLEEREEGPNLRRLFFAQRLQGCLVGKTNFLKLA